MLLAGLTTGHKVGLGVVALIFIGFALVSSFVAPRRRPDFPGRHGLSVFVIACFVLFAAMLASVMVFGRESEAKGAQAAAKQPAAGKSIAVQEKEWKVVAPVNAPSPGTYTFTATNAGKIQHNLAITGPGIAGAKQTPLISPGKSATLTVTLAKGTYTLYCAVPGHRQLGMVTKLNVG